MGSKNLEDEQQIMREMFNDPDDSQEPASVKQWLIGLAALAAYVGVVQLIHPLFG